MCIYISLYEKYSLYEVYIYSASLEKKRKLLLFPKELNWNDVCMIPSSDAFLYRKMSLARHSNNPSFALFLL